MQASLATKAIAASLMAAFVILYPSEAAPLPPWSEIQLLDRCFRSIAVYRMLCVSSLGPLQ